MTNSVKTPAEEIQYSKPKFWKTISFRILVITALLLGLSMLVLTYYNSRVTEQHVQEYYDLAGRLVAEFVSEEMRDFQDDLSSFADSETAQMLHRLCRNYEINDVWIGISSPPYDSACELIYISRNKIVKRTGEELEESRYELSEDERSIYLGSRTTAHNVYTFSGIRYVSYKQGIYDDEGNCIGVCGADFLEEAVDDTLEQSVHRTTWFIGLLFLALLIILTVLLYVLVVSPVRRISQSMRNLVQQDDLSVQRLEVKGENELSMMAKDFNIMADEIRDYVQTMDAVRAAAQIQKGLLPDKRYEDEHLKIEALMIPARNVGGDFYDYFRLEDGRTCFIIADVSGKGISAALFMAGAVNCIRYNARLVSTPAQILKKVNDDITSHNPGQLFVTVFLAIYDPASGRLTWANAGHNPPYLLSGAEAGDGAVRTLRMLDHDPGLLIGLFEDETYEDLSQDIHPNDILFLFTDGVNEAVSPDRTFFGNDRLERSLEKAAAAKADQSFTELVLADIEAFSAESEQHDDITMLSVLFKPF